MVHVTSMLHVCCQRWSTMNELGTVGCVHCECMHRDQCMDHALDIRLCKLCAKRCSPVPGPPPRDIGAMRLVLQHHSKACSKGPLSLGAKPLLLSDVPHAAVTGCIYSSDTTPRMQGPDCTTWLVNKHMLPSLAQQMSA